MENVKVPMYKRILAYIIDFLIVAIVSALVMYAMPHSEKYNETINSSSSIRELLSKEDYNSEEYLKRTTELTYDSYKYGLAENSITIVIMLAYFSLFTYFNHGQTIGKKLVKTKAVDINGNEPSLLKSFGRSIIISRSFGDIITLILVLSMKKTMFVKSYYYIDLAITLLWIACPIIAIWRQDGRGLHDLVAGTMVLDKRKLPQEEEKVVEAKIEEYKEKKDNNKKKNKKK